MEQESLRFNSLRPTQIRNQVLIKFRAFLPSVASLLIHVNQYYVWINHITLAQQKAK